MGATFILGSIIFALLILMFLAIWCINRNRKSEKLQKCISFLKNKIYLNPVLRYLMLNSLKLNFVALSSLKMQNENSAAVQVLTAILILVMIDIVTPILLSRLLYKKRHHLEEPDVK